jgi:DNA repair photolyase
LVLDITGYVCSDWNVRWNNLTLDAPPAADILPFSLPGAVVRTFDTPGFAGMTFYEIQSKSIISRVPAASRMPFEWTINPYRGCSHACVYCQTGDTPILMADGRTRPLSDLRVGDRIYGTVREGNYRRYVVTTVLAHWQTVKPAYRVRLADGTELTASADHRYLTDRGWKFVTGASATRKERAPASPSREREERAPASAAVASKRQAVASGHGSAGAARRPYLTTNNKLMGTGAFAGPPKDSTDYRTGYLRGIGGSRRTRLDDEVEERAREYVLGCDVTSVPYGSTGLLEWPTFPSEDWHKGFLAGIFDAEGSGSGCIRIANTDPVMLSWIQVSLARLGFDFVLEPARGRSRVYDVRVRGGLRERLRFFHTVDPAITRKRQIAGTAIKSDAPLTIESITPLGLDLPMYDITTGTGDFIANGVVSHNCFARHTHTYLDLDAGHDFDTKVVVKVNAPQLLRRELAAAKWTGAHIAMGTNVDCYQRAEGKYELMRGIIAALRDHANPFSILTKGTLITRDLDLIRQAAEVTTVGVSFSVGFINAQVWRSVEPGTPSPRRRLDAVRRFADAGFAVTVLMAPVLPGLTDTDESIDETVAAIAASGAAGVTPLTLHLRPGAREWYAAWLGRNHPHLVERYRAIYGKGSYAPNAYQRDVSARVAIAARRHGIGRQQMSDHRRLTQPDEEANPPPPEQLTLL